MSDYEHKDGAPVMTGLHWAVNNTLNDATYYEPEAGPLLPTFAISEKIVEQLRAYFKAEPESILADLRYGNNLPTSAPATRGRVPRTAISTPEYSRRMQAASIEKADRHYAEWQSWEIDLVSNRSLRARDVATTTGRTLAAITGKRRKLKEEARHEAHHHQDHTPLN